MRIGKKRGYRNKAISSLNSSVRSDDKLFKVRFCFCRKLRCRLYGSTEGAYSKLSELERLLSEGDTDNCDAPNNTEQEMSEHKLKSAKDKPNDISYGMRSEVGLNLLTHRPEGKLSELECLNAEGDTDNGNTPTDTDAEP